MLDWLKAGLFVFPLIICGWLFLQNRKLKETIVELTTIDEETGLKNKAYTVKVIERYYLAAKRYKHSFTVGFITINTLDVDKDRKDFLTFICEVAQQLSLELRATDVLGRFDENHFLIGLTHTHSHNARVVFDRMLQTLVSIKGPSIVKGFNMGVAHLSEDTQDVHQLLKEAKEALKQSHQNGLNTVQYYGL